MKATVVAVSKGRSVEEIQKLYDSGQRDFGENRVQEALEKIRSFKEEIRQTLSATDEDFVKTEIKKSRQKRFNIRDHWLPLQ